MVIVLRNADEFLRLLVRRGLSKRALAQLASVGEATLIQISNGDRHPSPKTAKRITEALQVDFDDIFEIRPDGGDVRK